MTSTLAFWTAHFCVHTCIVLNKNWKTYWYEQSFAGLRPKGHVFIVRTGLFHDVYQRGISRNIFHDCGKFYLLFEWGIVVQELETSNFTAEWKLYRITAILKFETDIIANISASPIGWAGIFVMMSVEAFRTNFIVFIGDGIMCLTSDWQINLHLRVTNWPNIFVDQGQLSDPDFISGTHQRENVQFANKIKISYFGRMEELISNPWIISKM